MSCPMSVGYIVGERSAESLQRDFTALTDLGIKRVQAMAEDIDRSGKTVTANGQALPYDFLVVSLGIAYMEDAIPGFAEFRDQLPVGMRAFEQGAVKTALDADESGDIVLSVPPMPFRFPIAPYERAARFADWINRNNKPGKLILLDQNPDIAIGKPAISTAFEELYADRIDHRTGIEFQSVNADTRTIETNEGKLTYGMASLLPPQQAAEVIRASGLGDRWAPIRFPTFQSKADDDVYIIGDSIAAKLPKSGHLAFESGIRVAEHIVNRINRSDAEQSLDLPSAICFASFNGAEAMGVNVSASWDDFREEIEVKPTVDKARSAGATAAAQAWSNGIWNQLLG